MDKLMEFLQKEVPSNASDLNDSISNIIEIIERTRAALASKVTRLFQDGETEFQTFTEANKQLSDMEKFLKVLTNNTPVEPKQEQEKIDDSATKPPVIKPDYESCKIDETKPYSLDADFSKKRPYAFTFEGKKYYVKSWNKLLVMVCEILNQKNQKLFQSFPEDLSMQGRTRKYFLRKETKYHQKVGGTDIWILTNNDGSANCRTIMRMFEKYNIPITAMEIFLRADYSLLQNDDDEDDNDISFKKKHL